MMRYRRDAHGTLGINVMGKTLVLEDGFAL